MTSSFNIGHIERSILAILHALHNMGSKGTGGAFDPPTQVTIRSHNECLCAWYKITTIMTTL